MTSKYIDNISDYDMFPDGKVFRLSYDVSVLKFKIFARSFDAFSELRDAFSCDNPNAFFVRQYGYKVDNKLYAINKFGYFSIGLVWEVFKWLKSQYGSLSVLVISTACMNFINEVLTPLKSYVKKLNLDDWHIANVSDDTGRNAERANTGKPKFIFRDYLENAIKQLLVKGYGRGLIEIPTAGGKSFILANFCWNLHKQYSRNLKFLLLVPNKLLVNQMHSDFIDYGYDRYDVTMLTAGLKGDDKYNPDAQVIMSNRQYLFKHKDMLPNIDVLICDEVHTALSDTTYDFIDTFGCNIKIGCSGTLPRDQFNKWKILGLFSQIVYLKDIVELQDSGYISKLKITLLKIRDTYVEGNTDLLFNMHSKHKYRADEFGYSDIAFDDANKAEHEYFAKHYQELYVPVFDYVDSLTSNTLILFDRIEIGQNLHKFAKEKFKTKQVHYIDGSVDVETRELIRNSFELSDDNVLFAQTSTFSTGINIKRLTNLIFLTGSKSFSLVLQSIGRTLRLHDSKDTAHLIDISWNYKYSDRHLKERLKIYKSMYHKTPDEVLHRTI